MTSISPHLVGFPARSVYRSRRRRFQRVAFAATDLKCEVGLCRNGVLEGNLSRKASGRLALELLKSSPANRYSREKSCIAVIGVNFRTAPVEMLEKLAVPEAGWPRAIKELCNLNHIEEAAVLSTSNGTEVYVVALSWHRGVKEVTEWMAKASGVSSSEIRQHLFLLRDSDASQHLFEVSTGLESLIPGESQIQSKVEEVVNVCRGLKGFGENITELFEDAIMAGRRVHDDLSISSGAVSEVNDHKEVEFDEEEQLRQATKAQTIIMEAVKKFEVRRDQNQLLTSATVHNLNKYANRILESELKTFSQKIGGCDSTEVKKTVEIHMNNILRELLSGPCKHLTENHNLSEVLQNTLVTERVFKLETKKSVIEKKIRAKLEQSQT